MVAVFAVLTVAFEVCSAVLIVVLPPFSATLVALAMLDFVLIPFFVIFAEASVDSLVLMVFPTDSAVCCS